MGDKGLRGIVLHGGYGTRLRPLTFTGPKQLIPVANKPISQHVIEDLRDSGVTDIAVVLGNSYSERVKEYYGDGSKLGVHITYVYQGEPKGIAHATGLCEEFAKNEQFIVYLGDNLLQGGTKRFVTQFKDKRYDAMILLASVKAPQRFGVAKFDENNRLIGLVEKPEIPPSNYALAGIYFFTPAIFSAIRRLKPSRRGELEITEAIQLMLDDGLNVGYEFVQGWWKDTGRPEDLLEANHLVLADLDSRIEGTLSEDTQLSGRVTIGSGTHASGRVIIRGPAIIGQSCKIGPDVYIGPYTSVGDGCILKNVEIENSIIMRECVIEAGKRITDSLIGSYSIITNGGAAVPQGQRLIIGERSFAQI